MSSARELEAQRSAAYGLISACASLCGLVPSSGENERTHRRLCQFDASGICSKTRFVGHFRQWLLRRGMSWNVVDADCTGAWVQEANAQTGPWARFMALDFVLRHTWLEFAL